MIALEGNVVNKYKLIHAYFKRENIDFSESDKYYNMPNLEELIQSKYDIKVMDWKHMQKAKKIGHAETEHEIQCRLVNYLKENKIGHFAVCNGFIHNGSNPLDSAKYINYLKQEGYKPGMYDLVILPGNGKVAFLELKTLKGTPGDNQIKWREWFNANGYINKICYGYDEAIEFIKSLF